MERQHAPWRIIMNEIGMQTARLQERATSQQLVAQI
jgi:hypothetical protein